MPSKHIIYIQRKTELFSLDKNQKFNLFLKKDQFFYLPIVALQQATIFVYKFFRPGKQLRSQASGIRKSPGGRSDGFLSRYISSLLLFTCSRFPR